MRKYITKISGLVPVVAAMGVIVFLMGCSAARQWGNRAVTYNGPSRDLGGGRAYTFATMDSSGNLTAIGLRISEAALTGLPAEPPQGEGAWEYDLALPKEAAASGYDHVGIDWNPHGHIPDGIYNVPHFDFHFYMISKADRGKISAMGEDLEKAHKAPSPEFMPAGYVLPPGTEVPRMGAHAIDPASPEFNNMPFSKTFIYGFYDGQMIFLEPMVSKAFLETKPDTTDPIKLPAAYAKHAYYPTMYSVKYDTDRREVEISLGGLIYN